jgi:hypothetical protein
MNDALYVGGDFTVAYGTSLPCGCSWDTTDGFKSCYAHAGDPSRVFVLRNSRDRTPVYINQSVGFAGCGCSWNELNEPVSVCRGHALLADGRKVIGMEIAYDQRHP